jgi:hypothetical protein
MKAEITMAGNAKTKKIIAYGTISLLGAIALLAAIFFLRSSSDYALSLNGISEEASITAQITQKDGVSSLASSERKKFHYKSPSLTSGNYILAASIKENESYRDIRFSMDRARHTIIISASGFKPQESFSVKIENAQSIDDLHFDWSGRLEINQTLPAKMRQGAICLKSASGFSACHHYDLKGGRA